MRVAGIVVVACLIPGIAAADERRDVGEGYQVQIAADGLWVRKGKQRARFANASAITKATLDKKARTLTVEAETWGCGTTEHSWALGHVDAKLENTTAYLLHRKKDYKGAAAGFARAVAADPTWNIPAYNLASARQLMGDKPGAIAALAPWLASAPLSTYVQVSTDPELAPLLDQPELAAMRAKTPGNVTVTAKTVDGVIGYDPAHSLIAVARKEEGWGAGGYFTSTLEIYDLDGKLVASTPLVLESETGENARNRSATDKRAKQLQTMLSGLGFTRPKVEAGKSKQGSDNFSLPKAKLGLAYSNTDGKVRVLQKDTVLGQGDVYANGPMNITRVEYVEEPKAVVVWTQSPGSEGCMGTDPTDTYVIKLTPPAPKP